MCSLRRYCEPYLVSWQQVRRDLARLRRILRQTATKLERSDEQIAELSGMRRTLEDTKSAAQLRESQLQWHIVQLQTQLGASLAGTAARHLGHAAGEPDAARTALTVAHNDLSLERIHDVDAREQRACVAAHGNDATMHRKAEQGRSHELPHVSTTSRNLGVRSVKSLPLAGAAQRWDSSPVLAHAPHAASQGFRGFGGPSELARHSAGSSAMPPSPMRAGSAFVLDMASQGSAALSLRAGASGRGETHAEQSSGYDGGHEAPYSARGGDVEAARTELSDSARSMSHDPDHGGKAGQRRDQDAFGTADTRTSTHEERFVRSGADPLPGSPALRSPTELRTPVQPARTQPHFSALATTAQPSGVPAPHGRPRVSPLQQHHTAAPPVFTPPAFPHIPLPQSTPGARPVRPPHLPRLPQAPRTLPHLTPPRFRPPEGSRAGMNVAGGRSESTASSPELSPQSAALPAALPATVVSDAAASNRDGGGGSAVRSGAQTNALMHAPAADWPQRASDDEAARSTRKGTRLQQGRADMSAAAPPALDVEESAFQAESYGV